MRTYHVALCGLSPRDQRLLEIVVNRPSFGRHSFKATDVAYAPEAEIAIHDLASEQSSAAYAALKARHPSVVGIGITDGAMPAGGEGHFIQRTALLVSIFGVLNGIVESGESAGAPTAPSSAAVPVAGAPPARGEQAFTDQPGPPLERLHALVVDDSLAVRQQLLAGLQRLGFTCEAVDSAEAAQIALATHQYQLALLDVVMPGMDGYDLCRAVKRDRNMRKMPVVMLTSRSSPFDRARGTLSGCDAYLTKPVGWAQFAQTVTRVMNHWAHGQRVQLAELGFIATA